IGQPRPPAKSETAAPVAPAPTIRPALPDVAPPRPAPVPPRATLPESRAAQSVTTPPARHQVVWFDIPVRDIDRALRFYSAVLGTQLKKDQAGPGVAMAELPHSQGSIGGCLVQNIDAKPSESGPLLYLNTQGRLEQALIAVEKHGGKVLSETQSIAP